MKRSEINRLLSWGKEFLATNNIRLPALAYWSPAELRARRETLGAVKRLELGWDITDLAAGTLLGSVLCYTLFGMELWMIRLSACRIVRNTS